MVVAVTAVCGVSWGTNSAAVDAAVAAKPPTRLYTTLDTPAPAAWQQIAQGRKTYGSLKPKLGGVIETVADVLAHKWDGQLKAYVQWLMTCGIDELEIDHEIDAKTAAAGGTPAQLDQMIGYIWDLAASVGWKGGLVTGLTGFDEVDRGPLFKPILDRATKIMVDSGYSTAGNPSFADAAGPSLDWLTANYPGKPVVMGEMGCTGYAGRAAWIAAAGNSILTDPRFAPLTEAIWWDATTGSFDTRLSGSDLTAWVAVVKASLIPPNPLRGQLDAALAEIVTLEGQHATDQATIAGLQGMIATARTALGA